MEFNTGKSDKDYSIVSEVDRHQINAREFFIPTQVLFIWLLVTY